MKTAGSQCDPALVLIIWPAVLHIGLATGLLFFQVQPCSVLSGSFRKAIGVFSLKTAVSSRFCRPDDISSSWITCGARVLRRPIIDITLVDVRRRELTIKGQEILPPKGRDPRQYLVQFQVSDPQAATLAVASYEEAIYSDVQLARASFAGRHDARRDPDQPQSPQSGNPSGRAGAGSNVYGVEIRRADVKDLIFPGNLQEVMNRVLQAERISQAELVEAHASGTCPNRGGDQAAAGETLSRASAAEAVMIKAQADAAAQRISTQAELSAAGAGEGSLVYTQHPVLLRLEELQTLCDLAPVASSPRIHIGFDRFPPQAAGDGER